MLRRGVLAVAAVVVVSACGTSQPSAPSSPTVRPETSAPTTGSVVKLTGPESAVSRLMRALEDGDCRRARALVVTPSQLGCDDVEMSAGSFEAEGIDLSRASYRSGAVHDDSAVVAIRWDAEHPRESYEVQRVAGSWKVVFDSAA